MKIVETVEAVAPKKDLQYLRQRKAQLKRQIQQQEDQISASVKYFFTPGAIAGYALKYISKSFNVVDSFFIGYKLMRAVRRFFK